MTLSLNEVEATAKKAARGAGYSWGLAEEAGKAARWLCARDLDGCKALAGLLQEFHGAPQAHWTPMPDRSPWQAQAERLCPLITGATISDRAHDLHDGSFVVSFVIEPALLLPFAASCALQLKAGISVKLPEASAVIEGDALEINGAFPSSTEAVTISIGGSVSSPSALHHRATPLPQSWQILNRFAERTYAPATEASRLSGAGAGLSDND